jgi:putative addiction module component (TIGR02574 family)
MTKTAVEELLRLPAEERLEIAEILCKSVDLEAETRFVSIPAWQREILRGRLDDLERNPDDEQPWEEVKAELWPSA